MDTRKDPACTLIISEGLGSVTRFAAGFPWRKSTRMPHGGEIPIGTTECMMMMMMMMMVMMMRETVSDK